MLWKTPRKRKAVVPLEKAEQIKLCTWMTRKGILYYAIPNGGSRNMLEAVNLKRQGLQPGVPDLCIPIARKSHHGLYIELKRQSKGKLSEHQTYWLEQLSKEGYLAKVCYGADEAILLINDYLS